jgi:hypothetical protein
MFWCADPTRADDTGCVEVAVVVVTIAMRVEHRDFDALTLAGALRSCSAATPDHAVDPATRSPIGAPALRARRRGLRSGS